MKIDITEEKLTKHREFKYKFIQSQWNMELLQAEVWKSDFDAERDARERLHADKTQLEADFKQLQLRNQQLLDEMESFSKRQFQEMQQRHSNQGYQHSIQQHLRVGQQNHGSPYQFPHYPPQGYPSQSPGAGAMYNEARSPVAAGGQVHEIEKSQKSEENTLHVF